MAAPGSSAVDPAPHDPRGPRTRDLYAVVQQVRPLHRLLTEVMEETLEGTGLAVSSHAVLEHLALHGPLTVPQLGRALTLPRQVVQRLVDELLALKLVEPRGNPGHRRSHLFAATPAGQRAVDAVRARQEDDLTDPAEQLGPEQAAAAVAVMTALTEHFGRRVARRGADATNEADDAAAGR